MTMMSTCSELMLAPPIVKRRRDRERRCGYGIAFESTHSRTAFCRKIETPIAEISGASRGAWRSGRYANRSMSTPRMPIATIATPNTIANRHDQPEGAAGEERLRRLEKRQERHLR